MSICLLIFSMLLFSTSAFSKDLQSDSIDILSENTTVQVTDKLLKEGIQKKDEYAITDALRKLVMEVNRKRRVLTNDSIIQYLKIADQHLTGEHKRSFITEVRLRHIRSLADWGEDESKVIEELVSPYNNPDQQEDDIYYQIERNYALGMAAALGVSDNGANAYKNTLRYYDRLFELIQELPLEYGAEILFWVNENIYIGYINSKSNEKAVRFLEKMMETLNRYKELPHIKKDTLQDFEYVYSLYNEGLAYFPTIVGYRKSFECLKKVDTMMRGRGDLISLYFTYKGFYDDLKDHRHIITYADSIIRFMTTYDAPVAESVIASMYKDQAVSYAALHDYKKAFELIQKHDVLQEKITDEKSQQLRADMDARYDLNRLELDKERLISRARQIALFSTLFVFVLSVAWGFNQRNHVNKLKKIQKKLIESNNEVIRQSERAQESEKMKTAFVNSICHEIRTPLNAINGFSSLLLDESIDDECKADFPGFIRENTHLLTRLLDDMLEVSNLSSSAEELPTEQVDILAVCTREMEKIRSTEKKDAIEYRLDIADDCLQVRTNASYLSQAIAHLLGNANKFTESGTITLAGHKNPEGKLELSVTDTGIGIPPDKRKWVFERFAKLDEFKPGNGLGLHICQLIVNRLGGTIRIDDTYQNGTRLIITL